MSSRSRRGFAFAARTPVLLGSALLTIVLLVGVFPALPIGGEMLDVRPGYTHEEAVAALEGYGESGRRMYILSSLTLDTLLPATYVTLLAGLLYRLRPGERWEKLAFLPLLAGAFDLAENARIVVLLTGYPELTTGQVAAASFFTQAKGLAVVCCLLLVAALAAVRVFRRN